jgi:multidrug efflux pump subunit AcrB
VQDLDAAVDRCKEKLAEFPGVFDVTDDSVPGKWEFRLRIKEEAMAMGVRAADLAETVRATYYGQEVMRLQRGRHEVKLMVRYPKEDRHTLAGFNEIRVRADDGTERPLTELANVEVVRGYSKINRIDQLRCVTITADVEESVGNAHQIVATMRAAVLPELLDDYPGLRVRWEGQQEQQEDSLRSMLIGFAVALLAMYVLLAFEFKSYAQPLLILLIIPFGMIGAIAGHAIQDLPLTIFSIFGVVALSGILINDSIVLTDFINTLRRTGMSTREALTQAGQRRFRPVMLTTVTTVGGLTPILLETSFQAQMLIPMATSIAFGEIFATVLVLYLVPVLYSIYAGLSSS